MRRSSSERADPLTISSRWQIHPAPTIFPAVAAGQYDIGASTWGSLVVAWSKGLPLKAVGPGDVVPNDAAKDYVQVVTLKKSGLTRIKQLEGKTIGLPVLKSLAEGEMDVVAKKGGADPSKIHMVVIPFPEVEQALLSGRIDAAQSIEPFLTQLKQDTDVNVLAGANSGR